MNYNRNNHLLLHGDPSQLAEVFRLVTFGPKEVYPLHRHMRLEINYVKKGGFSCTIDGERIHFYQGEMLILFPNVEHDFEAHCQGCVLMQLEFMPDVFDRYEEFIDREKSECLLSLGQERKYLKLINRNEITSSVQAILNELNSEAPNRYLMIVMYYGILLLYLYRRINEDLIVGCNDPLMHKVVAFVKENYALPQTSVATLVEQLGISERNLRRMFQKYVGLSPTKYINKIRIEQATVLLCDCHSERSIKEICYMCGFSSPHYFSKIYKQFTGHIPTKMLVNRSENKE